MTCPHCGDPAQKHTGFKQNGANVIGCTAERDIPVEAHDGHDAKIVEGVCGCARMSMVGKTIVTYDTRGQVTSCVSDTAFAPALVG